MRKLTYSPLRSIFRRIDRKPPYNILCAPINARYIQSLSHTKHNFYIANHPNNDVPFGENDYINNMIPFPYDIHNYDKCLNVDFDLIISEHKNLMMPALQLSTVQQIPILHIENHWCHLSKYAANQYRGIACNHVFYSENQAKSYGFGGEEKTIHIINKALDSSYFDVLPMQKHQKSICVIGNGLQSNPHKNFQLLSTIKQQLPDFRFMIVGNNPNVSRYVDDSNMIKHIYNQTMVCLNLYDEPQSMSVMEAMSMQCPVVSIPTLESNLVNNNTARISNTVEGLIQHIKALQELTSEREELVKRARYHVVNNFGISTFIEKWNKLLESILSVN